MDNIEQGNPVVNRVSKTDATPEAAPEIDYDTGFGIMLAETLLEEAAEKMEGSKVRLPDLEQTILARRTIDSCQRSVVTLNTALPSISDIVADLYWDVIEKLNSFDLSFDALVKYHDEHDESEVEA